MDLANFERLHNDIEGRDEFFHFFFFYNTGKRY